MRRWLRGAVLLVPPVAWAALIFFLSSLPDLRSGLATGWDLTLRKLAHASEYAVLAVLIARVGFHERHPRPTRTVAAIAFVAAALYAVSDELHQTVVTGRHGAPLDVLIDSIGALAGLALYQRRRSARTRRP